MSSLAKPASSTQPTNGTHARRLSLAQFLRSRREQLQPEDVGLPAGGRRRTPGLRREEVAVLANLGVTWYTWLEQGRDIGTSAEVLHSIGTTLKLDFAEMEHLYELAGKRPPRKRTLPAETRVNIGRVLSGFTNTPAYAVDRYWYVVSTNPIAEYVFGITVGSNCLEEFFMNEEAAAHYPHRELAGRMMAAQFRRHAGLYPEDQTFQLIADEISKVSSDFKTYWDGFLVGVQPHVDVAYDHKELGRLTLETVVLTPDGGGDIRVFLYLPKAESGTTEALSRIK